MYAGVCICQIFLFFVANWLTNTTSLSYFFYTEEFNDNEELSAQYQMSLTEDDVASLSMYLDDTATELGDDHDDDADNCSLDDSSNLVTFPKGKLSFSHSDSVGGSALALLHLDDRSFCADDHDMSPKFDRRRSRKLAKFARITLCAAASSDFLPPKQQQQRQQQRHSIMGILPTSPNIKSQPQVPFDAVMKTTLAFSHILSFLNEGELIHSASLVCTAWADAATEALSTLMLASVGCDPSSFMSNGNDDELSCIDEELESIEECSDGTAVFESSSIAKSMEKDWSFLMDSFPWAQFLSDGAFKRVYKVWNENVGAYEAGSYLFNVIIFNQFYHHYYFSFPCYY